MGSIALWTTPEEIFRGTRLVYLIASEAFDWLTLAHRLTAEARDLIPEDELEHLLFTGRFPSRVDESEFKDILGVDKSSAYLNYFYGVEVETALQQVVEAEVEKRFYASGRQYATDHTNEAFQRIYNSTPRRPPNRVLGAIEASVSQRDHSHGTEGIHVLAVQAQAECLGQGEDSVRHEEGHGGPGSWD